MLLLCLSLPVWGKKRGYRKATEGQVVVLRKLFPKKHRLEINSNFGAILNQSFVDTMMLQGGISYHFSEEWGLAIEGAMAFNTDRAERGCVETFYNDFRKDKDARRKPLSGKCVTLPIGDGGDTAKDNPLVNVGPAYMPITEIGTLVSLSAVWSPV